MRRVLLAALVAIFVVGAAGVARADHLHVRILPTGDCVILAAEGKERFVQLPSANPKVSEDLPSNRTHPLHVLVHLGQPGAGGGIVLMGSPEDPCAEAGNCVNP